MPPPQAEAGRSAFDRAHDQVQPQISGQAVGGHASFKLVAIVGAAFRFPGDLATDQALWDALKEGRNLVTEVPAERWAVDELQHDRRSEPGRSVTFSAGVLSRIDEFDAAFFGISPREAAWLDPQQRLLLELAWEAMENAQIPASSLAATQCAVYVGISGLDYGIRGLDDLASMSPHSMTGNTLSVAANRLSYVFDLHGPSLAVDTACSSSLVALHHACMALQVGEASAALVGGVNLLLHPYPFVGFTKASMLSADGLCRPFDAGGKGYVRSEGGAVLLLKPLEQAEADGDDIRAVIRATGVNADGARKTGITIPSRDGQSDLMRAVLAKSGLAATDIDFIEAHGTGTVVGDPIETAAIGAVYGQGRPSPLPIGSVKANLGHLEPASGMAGLVKAVLALRHRALPAQIHLETLNPHIDFAQLNLAPVRGYTPLTPPAGKPLTAGVNSFGFGGANAHVLLQEYRCAVGSGSCSATSPGPAQLPPLMLSAQSEAALRALAGRYAERLEGGSAQDYYDVAHAAAHRRERLDKRLALSAPTLPEVLTQLQAYAEGLSPTECIEEDAPTETGGVAFVYSGNGAQWTGMGLNLLAESARFAEFMTELDALIQPVAGFSILAELQADPAASRLDDTVIAQPLLFAIQVALTRLLAEHGIRPQAVAGHSVGEVAAAWAAGAFSLDEAVRIIVARSQAQGLTRGAGRMAAAGLSAIEAQAIIGSLDGAPDITIAGLNSPSNVTLSGSLADLERLQAAIGDRGFFFRILDLDYAFHSRHMDPIAARLSESLAGLTPQLADKVAFVSTVTGTLLDTGLLDASYWWRNVREPVRFADALPTLAGLGCRSFVEIGPNAILQRYMRESLAVTDAKARLLSTLRKGADGASRITDTALRLHLLAPAPLLGAYFPIPARRVSLPSYPWQRERHWHPRSIEGLAAIERRRVHPLLGWRIPEADWSWDNTLDPQVLPWLADHKVGGAVVFPGAAYAEMALAAAQEWLSGGASDFKPVALEQLDILAPLVFDGEHARALRFTLNPRDGSFQIRSRQRLSSDEWTLHAAGRVLAVARALPAGQASGRIARTSGVAVSIDRETHYKLASSLGLDYGPAFQLLTEARIDGTILEASLGAHSGASAAGADSAAHYLIHPGVLDACYQSLVDFFHAEIASGMGMALLPVKTGEFSLHRRAPIAAFRASLRRRSARSVLADFELFDADGHLVAQASACRFRAAPLLHREEQGVAHWQTTPWLQPHPLESGQTRLPGTPALRDAIERTLDAHATLRKGWFKEALPLFEAMVVSFAYEAFRAVAQNTAGGAGIKALATARSPYVRWLCDLLRQEGLLTQQADVWTVSADDGSVPAAIDIWQTLQREHPDCLPQLVLVGRVGRALPQLLSGELDVAGFAVQLARSPAAETRFDDDPAYLGTRHALAGTLCAIAGSLPAHRRLRVLELTAGISELPRSLLEQLPEDRLDYVLALPDEAAVARQQAEYAEYANLTVANLAVASWQLSADKPLPGIFDVVIIRHVLHKALNVGAALTQVHAWLAAGGRLLVAERHPDISADFIEGLAPGWWHDQPLPDLELGTPSSSLLAPQAWQQAFQQKGFDDVDYVAESEADGLAEGAYLVLARRPEHALAPNPAPGAASWLLLVDAASSAFGSALGACLEATGQRVRLATELESAALDDLHHVVSLRGWAADAHDAAALLGAVLADVQRLASAVKPPKLWLLTRGGALGSNLPPTLRHQPAQAAMWGFGRVLMNEHPALDSTLIELASSLDDDGTIPAIATELLHPDGTREILRTDAGRFTLVMREAHAQSESAEAGSDRFRLDFRIPGQLRNLLWLPQPARVLAEGEIEVRTQATGLNFRDVMYLMGLLPDEAVENGFAGASLGLEFAGVVSRVGPGVDKPCVGDKVMGFGSACFASHVVTHKDAVARMPAHWSFAAGATVPTVFLTVYYALKQLASLEPGERVLIHGGAGGVGIAAIQLARHLGAEVFATAGSEDKRDFVRMLGADYVFDSRSLAFADDVLAATQGEGVDVILNSLAGEAIRRNLRVLKPFGRFLELGKRDFFENTPIGLRPFKDNISYFGIDADQLLTGRPQLAARMFGEVMELFRQGVLSPLPHRVFHAGRIVDAFRVMQQARHIGKVVVAMHDAQPKLSLPAPAQQAFSLAGNGAWLVTGGLSGFGLAAARWLAEHGVSRLVLVSRRGAATPGAESALAELSALGVHVQALACDITDAEAVTELVESLCQGNAPLAGILHAAMVIDDKLIGNLDAASIHAVLQPKLVGAWNLHQATLQVPLEHFVLFSSITTSIGNPGQANYVAANAALEGLAAMRRALGLPAVSVGWGPIGDAGYLTRNTTVRDSLAQRLGKPPLSAQQALDQLPTLLSAGSCHAVANFDWNVLARLLPSANSARFAILNRSRRALGAAEDEADFRALIAGKSPEQVGELVRQLVIQEVAQILAIAPERIDPARSLHDLGLDSLMAVELALGLERRLGIPLPVMMLNEAPTADKVTRRIVDKLVGGVEEEGAAPASSLEAIAEQLAYQHGEAVATDETVTILEDARALAQQGTVLTR